MKVLIFERNCKFCIKPLPPPLCQKTRKCVKFRLWKTISPLRSKTTSVESSAERAFGKPSAVERVAISWGSSEPAFCNFYLFLRRGWTTVYFPNDPIDYFVWYNKLSFAKGPRPFADFCHFWFTTGISPGSPRTLPHNTGTLMLRSRFNKQERPIQKAQSHTTFFSAVQQVGATSRGLPRATLTSLLLPTLFSTVSLE